MDALAFLIAVVALAAYVAAPLYRASTRPLPAGDEAGRARLDALVRALRELELDRAAGLVTEAAYRAARTDLEAQAADALRLAEWPPDD